MQALTNNRIATAVEEAADKRRNVELADGDCKGLRLRIGYGGSATFSLMYRPAGASKQRRITIGKYPDTKLSEARKLAIQLKADVTKGSDPIEIRKAERAELTKRAMEAEREAAALAGRMTVAELAERFLHDKRKLRWAHRYRQMLNYNLLGPQDRKSLVRKRNSEIAAKALEDLEARDIEDVLASVVARGSEVQARRLYETLRAMIRWGIKKGYVPHNPIQQVSVPDNSKPRERYLSVAELRTVWASLTEWDEAGTRGEDIPIPLAAVRVLRLQLMLAQRSGEITGMQRQEISEDGLEWIIPAERAKNGHAHRVPLPPLARSIVDAACVASKHKTLVFPVHMRSGSGYNPLRSDVVSSHVGSLQDHFEFRDRAGVSAPFTSHDFRRTVATYLRKASVGSDVVAAILNHITNKAATVTGKHYDKADLGQEMRVALTKWQAIIEVIANGFDPFFRSADDVAELERRIIGEAPPSCLVAIERGQE